MPIIKCPKCGEEYDSMYSLHSYGENQKKINQTEKDIIIGNFLKFSFLIYAIIVIVLFFYALFNYSGKIKEIIEISLLGGFIIAIFIILPLYLFRARLPIIKIGVSIKKLKSVYPFLRKNLLFLLPLILLILYFLSPLLIATPKSLSQTKAERCFFESCIPDKWLKEELNYSEAVNYCKAKCNYQSYRYYYGDKTEIKHTPIGNLFFKNLIKNSAPYYQKIFRFQNIIIMLLGLILYYAIIFGINITKRLEKQR